MDRLTLRIENRSDAAGDLPEDISVLGQGISIGRKIGNDWTLPDNSRFISGTHVRVVVEDDSYVLEDVSTNGTFVNGSTKRLEGKHKLENGDTIRIGSFIVSVDLVETRESARPQISGAQGVQAPPVGGPIRKPAGAVQRHAPASGSGRNAQTPDFSRFQTGGGGATGVQSPSRGISAPPAMGGKPAAAPIPEDFDDDLMGLMTPAPANDGAATPQPLTPDPAPVPPAPAATPQAEVAPPPAPEPAAGAPAPQPQAAPSAPADPRTGPFSPDDPTGAPAFVSERAGQQVQKPAVVIERTDLTPPGLGERFAETTPPAPATPPETPAPAPAAAPAPAPAAAPAPAPAPAPPATNELFEGFLEGAGIDDPDAVGFALRELGVILGKCARLGTQEMMQMLQDRSAVKLFVAQEDRTMRIASGNNPMKFMLDPDEAFTAMFVKPRDGYQTGPESFDNALDDIRRHQAAMMAAIQPALADMLEGLAPSDIQSDAGGGGGMLGSGARKSWEEYTRRWEARAAQGENGMLDAFLDAYSRRYNQALDSL